MTGVSRRALLGYSGSAAAGAALASAGTAAAADGPAGEGATAGERAAAVQAADPNVDVANGTEFRGDASIGDIDARMEISFKINIENAPAGKQITPTEIANALNEIGMSRGWPKVTFYYTTSAPLN
ncbi:hypothetical protein AB0H82_21145 [Streptomyces sp. NPDC050732]|uniref:hypothetical protein n=1 Tax=Streptomyces sp. NPDC050732 TaxID=3154632 RepID=UPI0034414197